MFRKSVESSRIVFLVEIFELCKVFLNMSKFSLFLEAEVFSYFVSSFQICFTS